MAKRKDIIIPGEKFHRLTVLHEIERGRWPSGRTYRRAAAQCECGIVKEYAISDLRKGDIKSCGCARYWRSDERGTRGHLTGAKSPEYNVWVSMIARCENEKTNRYDRYGAVGIKVCEEWHNFSRFLEDMGPRPSMRHTIDRISNNLGYQPGNCRWATYQEQAENRRSTRLIEYQGKIQSIAAWAREVGLPQAAVNTRITRLGWSLERAFTELVRRGKNQHG